MDELLRKVLEIIFKKEPQELNEYDRQFLRARVSYLTLEQKEKYAGALSDTPVKLEDQPIVAGNEPKKFQKK
jgi:hypothetical protein